MKTILPWVAALGIPEEDYQRWSSTVPADQSVTFCCLREGRIPVDAYLEWARDFYGLAILRSEFFLKTPNVDLFNKIKSVCNWSRELVPIQEWDGVIFVACSEPTEVTWSIPVRQVLANPADMEKYWMALTAAPVSIPTLPPLPKPAEVVMAFPPQPSVPVPPLDDLTKTNVANVSKKDADPFAALSEKISNANVTTSAIEGLPDLKINVDLNVPEGIASSAAALKVSTGGLEGLTDTAIFAASSTPAMPDNTFTAIRPSTGVPPPSKSNGTGVGQFAAEGVLKTLSSEFQGTMILKIEGERLDPWAWDSAWNSSQPNFIDLGGPSAFRVVYRTKMPYLGHIVETPVNSAFFKAWGYETLPDNVLVQPLVQNGQFLGMAIFKCDKQKKESAHLASAEKYSAQLVALLAAPQVKAA